MAGGNLEDLMKSWIESCEHSEEQSRTVTTSKEN